MPLLCRPGVVTAAPPPGPAARRAPEGRRIRRPGRPGAGPAAPPPAPAARRAPEGRRIRRPGRVTGLDVARALAVFGMLGAHFAGVPADIDASPSSWLGVVHGRSSILFAVLAGV